MEMRAARCDFCGLYPPCLHADNSEQASKGGGIKREEEPEE